MRKFIARILCFCVGVSSLFAFGGCTNRAYTRELIDALENNDMKKFTRMVNYGFNLDARPLPKILSDNATNRPPLVVAVANGNFEAVKILVEAGASVNVRSIDNEHYTPLLLAAHEAALYGSSVHYDIAYYLIEHGADIHAKGYYGESVISMFLGCYDGSEQGFDFFLYLLEQGATLEESLDGHVLFQACSSDKRLNVVEYIFDNYEIDVNMRSRRRTQHTLLMDAVPPHGCAPIMCQYLLDKGADKTLKDVEGKTAYDLAVERQEFLLNKGYGDENEYLVEVNTLIELLK